MKIDNNIKRALKDIPIPYKIEKSKDHYFVRIQNYPRIIIGGNHDKSKAGCVKASVKSLKKIKKLIDKEILVC